MKFEYRKVLRIMLVGAIAGAAAGLIQYYVERGMKAATAT